MTGVDVDELRTADGLYPCFSAQEFAGRHNAVREILDRHGLQALVAYGNVWAHNEVQYLTNFPVSWEAMLVFPREGAPVLLVHFHNHQPTARRISIVDDVRWLGPDPGEAVATVLQERGLARERLGMAGLIPVSHHRSVRQALPHAELTDISGEMAQLRLTKSEEEIAFLRRGAELSDLAIEALERGARPGVSEHELAAIVEGAYLGRGGKNVIHFMGVTPMKDPDLAVPAQHHSSRPLQEGDVLLTEISAQYHGYFGQILRPFAIGDPPTPGYKRIYDVAVEVYGRVRDAIRPGATADDVLDAAEYVHESGFTIHDDLVHGIAGNWSPVLRTRRTSPREPAPFRFVEDMTVVIQPNPITEDERMGMQVGDLVRVTAEGAESLHTYPMRFIECGT
jgi:Xaa-Pro dipeptidase